MKNIHFIGFSVTNYGDPSYNDLVKKNLIEKNIITDVQSTSFGGLSVDSLCGLIDIVIPKIKENCIVVLEIATSFYSLQKKDKVECDEYLRDIVLKLVSLGFDVVFLNLYREDISDDDVVVQCINEIAAELNLTVISLKSYFRNLKLTTGDDGTVDGVHPTPNAANYIAEKVTQVLTHAMCRIMDHSTLIHNPKYSYSSLRATKFYFNGKGIDMYFDIIEKDDVLGIDYIGRLHGIVFLYGPDTSNVMVKFYQSDCETIIKMFDENSFYRRIGFRTVPSITSNHIDLELTSRESNVVLKREPWEKVLNHKAYISGLIIKN